MAIGPGTYNMTVQRRSDHSIQLIFKDSGGTAINLTNWSAAVQSWNQNRTKKYADWTVAYTNRAAGTIDISLSVDQTTILPDKSYYDVLLVNASGKKEYYLEGVVTCDEGYTTT
mgnify:CR=1 FL=1|tara:strand:- start:1222 stop:1563 length:342 start_codon:yes stop_codon:yes gene_type:complete